MAAAGTVARAGATAMARAEATAGAGSARESATALSILSKLPEATFGSIVSMLQGRDLAALTTASQDPATRGLFRCALAAHRKRFLETDPVAVQFSEILSRLFPILTPEDTAWLNNCFSSQLYDLLSVAHGDVFVQANPDNKTVARAVLKEHPAAYRFLSDRLKHDRELIHLAVRNECMGLYLPAPWCTRDSLLALSAINPKILRFMTQEMVDSLSPENRMIAFERHPFLIFVTSRPITEAQLLNALRANGALLGQIPEGERTLPRREAAGRQPCWPLPQVPEEARAIAFGPPAVWELDPEFVPRELKTAIICEAAVRQHGFALWNVRPEHQTDALYETAVRQHGLALGAVPVERRTADLCKLAVGQNGWALAYVPVVLRDMARFKASGCDLMNMPLAALGLPAILPPIAGA